MFAKINSSYLYGISGVGVEVECDVSSYGLPSFSIVGLGDNAIKESKDRVKSALKNLDHHYFNHPITINLAPADMKKDFIEVEKQVELFEKIDTTGVEPMVYPFEEATTFLREDIEEDVLSQEDALKNVKDVRMGHVHVPKVVK